MRARTSTATAAILAAAIALTACNRLVPSGFWKGYRKDSIVKQQSDQGPWGGERWILWESSETGAFSEVDAKRFAVDHSWTFLERVEMPAGAIDAAPVFFKGYDYARTHFPRFIAGDSVVLQFDSGWMREDPGTNAMSTAYGYLQLSKDGRKMVVYHLWGNW